MGIYGYTMNLNNTNSIVENKEYDLFSEAIIMSESIVYNEFCNHKALLEAFTGSEEERKVMEEKCDLLLEISMKDIKQKIHELFEKLKRFIREVVSRVKEFFTKERQKKMEQEIDELKNKIDNLEKDKKELDDSNYDLYNKNKELDKELKSTKLSYAVDRSVQNLDDKANKERIDKLEKSHLEKDEEIRSLHSKLAQEIAKTTKAYSGIMKMIDDPLLRFSMWDYVENNIDPVRYIMSSDFQRIKEYYGNTYRKMDNKHLEELKLYTSVFNKETMKKINQDNPFGKDNGKSNQLKHGGYDSLAVHRFIEKELERISKEKNPLTNKSVNEIIKHLGYVSEASARSVSRCAQLISNFEKAINILEKKITSSKFEKENITHMDAETKYEIKGNMEYAQFVVGHIKDQIQCLSVVSRFEGKKAGLAYSIIKLWNNTIVNK